MATCKTKTVTFSLLFITIFALTTLSYASDSRTATYNSYTPTTSSYNYYHPYHYYGGGATNSEKAEFMQVHNDARAAVGLPPLTWDGRLAYYAHSWAKKRINDCRLLHSDGPYGENIFWGSGGYSATFATKTWVEERRYYDWYTNSCAGGMDCGHYTQIVWRKSSRLGCSRVTCSNGGVFVICSYDPPGNYIGTRPY